jgi:hypothetical protein
MIGGHIFIMSEPEPKKRRTREKLPEKHPEGVLYGLRYRAGYRLFMTEVTKNLRKEFPNHFALTDKRHHDILEQNLVEYIWESLSVPEIRHWNNLAEPGHEEAQKKRELDEAKNRERKRRNGFIRERLYKVGLKGFGDYTDDGKIGRDQVLALYAECYDKAAAEYDAGQH